MIAPEPYGMFEPGAEVSLIDILTEEGLVSHEELSEILGTRSDTTEPLGDLLVRLGKISETQRLFCLGRQRGIEYIALSEFEIDQTPLRIAAFLAQAAHESGEFRYMEELASGKEYEGRVDLGNTRPGDGAKFKGRGIFQLTGETNYERAGRELYDDPSWLVSNPDRAAQPDNACRIAGWFWKTHGLNELADKGNFLLITKRINGGTNGWTSRVNYYERAKEVLS